MSAQPPEPILRLRYGTREMEAGARVIQELERRSEVSRRCAWCLRFHVNEQWKAGRRADDGAALPATTHTICDECVERLRREGLSV